MDKSNSIQPDKKAQLEPTESQSACGTIYWLSCSARRPYAISKRRCQLLVGATKYVSQT